MNTGKRGRPRPPSNQPQHKSLLSERDWRALSLITPFIGRYRWQVTMAMVCLVLITVCTLAVPYFMKLIVDALTPGLTLGGVISGSADNAGTSPPSAMVVVPMLALVGYGVVRFASVLFRELRDAIFGRVSVRAMRRLSLRVLNHLHALDLEYHLSRRTGAVSRDLDRGVNSVASLLRLMVFSILPTIMQLVGMTAVLLWHYDITFAVIAFFAVVIYSTYTVYITEWRTPFIRAANEANSRANNRAIDSLINYETVKQFGNEDIEARLYDGELKVWELARRRNRNSLAFLNAGQSFFTTLGVTVMMVLAAQHVAGGTMTLGDLVLVNAYAGNVFMYMNNLGGTYREFKGCLTDIELMFDILEIEPKIKDAPNAVALPPSNHASVSFNNVSFRYHENRPILQNVSFSVPAGHKVAIVGPSGSGKSTLARLLFRFYDPQQGSITLNGHDLSAITLDSLRAAIGMVPQDTTLFNSSLYENISYGEPDADDEQIAAAVRMAHLDVLIERLPDGLDTVVGERGLKLSGGEKQRVAIARAILKRPQLLVFDEATSSLDSSSEQAILTAIEEVAAGHTALVIAHRLSTVADADHIIVLDNGRVVEQGDHASLYALGGLYRELWDLQGREATDAGTPRPEGEAPGVATTESAVDATDSNYQHAAGK